MTLGKPQFLNVCLFWGIFLGDLKDEMNYGLTMIQFASVFSFAQLLPDISLRENVNVLSIDENQDERINEWEKQRAFFTLWNNGREFMCFLFLNLTKCATILVIAIMSTSPISLLLSVYRDVTLSSPYAMLFICLQVNCLQY